MKVVLTVEGGIFKHKTVHDTAVFSFSVNIVLNNDILYAIDILKYLKFPDKELICVGIFL